MLLGLSRDRIPAYVSVSSGYYIDGERVADLLADVRMHVDAGFSAIKIKVGGIDLDEDEERLAAIRTEFGSDVVLMADANNAWKNVKDAIDPVRRFETHNIYWLEEPLHPDDVEGHARLTSHIDTRIATGEIEATRWGFRPLIEQQAADVLQPDAAVAGGVSEWQKIANAAAMWDLPVAPHWFADLHVHCCCAAPNASWLEYFGDSRVLNIMKLFRTQLKVKEGEAFLPFEPGLGIELDSDAVDRFSVDPWS